MRIKIAAAFDDDVLDASGDENFVVGAVCAVASIYPREFLFAGWAKRKKSFGCLRIVVVAAGGGRSAKPQKAFGTIGNFAVSVIHNAYFVI